MSSGPNSPQYEYLQQSALASGIETIFNLDTLRPMSESPEATPFFTALHSALSSRRGTVLKALPRLFEHYVASLKRHRGAISTSSSSSQAGSSRAELNVVAMRFYASLQSMLDNERRDVTAWNAISDLTTFIAQESLYDSNSDPNLSLKKNVAPALEYLSVNGQTDLPATIVRCLSATIRVDYDLVLPSMGQILSRLLAVRPAP